MKIILALLALVLTCHAQTLRWSFTPDEPAFTYVTSTLDDAACDGLGNTAFVISYFEGTGIGTRYRVVWLDRAGRQVFSEYLTAGTAQPFVLRVSASKLYIYTIDDPAVVRTYTKRGKVVTSLDTPLAARETPVTNGSYPLHRDNAGFFTKITQDGVNRIVTIRRYLYR